MKAVTNLQHQMIFTEVLLRKNKQKKWFQVVRAVYCFRYHQEALGQEWSDKELKKGIITGCN